MPVNPITTMVVVVVITTTTRDLRLPNHPNPIIGGSSNHPPSNNLKDLLLRAITLVPPSRGQQQQPLNSSPNLRSRSLKTLHSLRCQHLVSLIQKNDFNISKSCHVE
jgi:hypothetical protein